jgi:hypothetical protein
VSFISAPVNLCAKSTKVSLLCTDQWEGYMNLGSAFPNETVDHANGQYVIDVVHTNRIEGFRSLIKRSAIGTYHKISAKYLPLYPAEFELRYTSRQNPDIFGSTIAGCQCATQAA